jgi:hypothetical protein
VGRDDPARRNAEDDLRERSFTREQTLTASIGIGGGEGAAGASDLCKLLECLAGGRVLGPEAMEALRVRGVDVKALLECLRQQCDPVIRKG